jgi:NAD(P)-dependent dehydrogenase (short-subunit alcohol dehydrogenase family)
VGALDGKVTVIAGGSSGIGIATAQRFVSDGNCVFITGRPQSEPDQATQPVARPGLTLHRCPKTTAAMLAHMRGA